jgi:hypothetical protein
MWTMSRGCLGLRRSLEHWKRGGSGGRGSCYHEGSVSSLPGVHNQAEAILKPVLAEAATY